MKKTTRKSAKERELAPADPAFEAVIAAFRGDPQVSRKRMFSSSNVLCVKGKIFAMLARGKLVVKLPKARVAELVSSGKGEHFDPGHGRLMKEWVALESSKPSWVDLAREAYHFVKTGRA